MERQLVINITLPPMPKAEDYVVAGSGPGAVYTNTKMLTAALASWELGAKAIGEGLANITIQED